MTCVTAALAGSPQEGGTDWCEGTGRDTQAVGGDRREHAQRLAAQPPVRTSGAGVRCGCWCARAGGPAPALGALRGEVAGAIICTVANVDALRVRVS